MATKEELIQYFKEHHYRTFRCGPVEEGIFVEIMVVDHCNLNCAGCDHFSSIANPRFMPIEEFKETCLLLKEKIPQLKIFSLWGGEPFLHPQFIELCRIANEVFPNLVQCGTNGLLLQNYSDEQLDELASTNVEVNLATYLLEGFDHETLVKRLQGHGIKTNYSQNRMHFGIPIVNPQGTEDSNQFYKCAKAILPDFTIRDYKMYKCPFACCSHRITDCNPNIIIPEEANDYLDIRTMTLDDIYKFTFEPNNACKYCSNEYFNNMGFWHQIDKKNTNYLYTLKDYFLYKYDIYEKFIHNEYFAKLLQDDFYKDNGDPCVCDRIYERDIIRYTKSKVDVIFVADSTYSKEDLLRVRDNLRAQSLYEDIIVYIISYNYFDEEFLYDLFIENNPLRYVLLKQHEEPLSAIIDKYCYGEKIFYYNGNDFMANETLENWYNHSLSSGLYRENKPTGIVHEALNIINNTLTQKDFEQHLQYFSILEQQYLTILYLLVNNIENITYQFNINNHITYNYDTTKYKVLTYFKKLDKRLEKAINEVFND